MLLHLRKFMPRPQLLLNYHFRIIFLVLVILSAVGILYNYHTQPDMRFCFMDHQIHMPPVGKRLEDVLLASHKPTPGRSIFFHETSCHPQQSNFNYIFTSYNTSPSPIKFVNLTARAACAIESAALHNPNSDVFVLFARPTYRHNATVEPLLDAILSYENIHLRNVNLWTYSAGTPIYEWFKNGALFKSRYILTHLSDFLRYLTLWRWGGTYLDMDIVMLQPMEDLPPNYTGAESNTHLAAGIMNFEHDGFGHEIAEMCLQDFQRNFKGNDWGNNGPGVITRVMNLVCETKNIALMLDRKRCMGFQVFPREAFYAIRWVEWRHFFDAKYLEQTLRRLRHSYVAHVWNKLSVEGRILVGSETAYGKLAEKHCPRVYAASGEYF